MSPRNNSDKRDSSVAFRFPLFKFQRFSFSNDTFLKSSRAPVKIVGGKF